MAVDPERPGFRCVQGFVNLLPSGDDDGGLMVLKEGHKVSEEYHQAFQQEERLFRWTNEVSRRVCARRDRTTDVDRLCRTMSSAKAVWNG